MSKNYQKIVNIFALKSQSNVIIPLPIRPPNKFSLQKFNRCKRRTSLEGRVGLAIQPAYVFWMFWVSDGGEDDRHGFVR
jgi:hypothetical protein